MHQRIVRNRFLGALGAATAFPTIAKAADEVHTLRLGLSQTGASPWGRAAVRYAQAVSRRTNGLLKIEVYPDSQLVSQGGTVNALLSGVIDFTIQGSTLFSSVLPELEVFDLPFLFKSANSGFRVLDGPIGNELAAKLEARGLLALSWGYAGLRQLETNKQIVVPEDMKGLRFRIQVGPIYVATFQALGAIPATIDASEAYTALSQHTIDGLDLPLPAFAAQKFYVVCKNVSYSNHVFSVQPLIGSKKKIEVLPANFQRILREEGRALLPWWRQAIADDTAATTQIVKQSGATFNETKYDAFRKAVDPVYAGFRQKYGNDLLDRVIRAGS